MERWLHRQVARDLERLSSAKKSTLELGGGTLNQLAFETDVEIYDVVEPFTALYEQSPYLGRVREFFADISDVPARNRYHRITSVAVLEHICDLPEVVARCCRLLAPGGSFRAAIPSEGTLLWTLGWKLTTGLEFRLKHGLDYGDLMRHEHVNSAWEIEEVLEYFFDLVSCRPFGLTKSLSLYRFYECGEPLLDRCDDYLRSRASGC
jgi:hypothetical protein